MCDRRMNINFSECEQEENPYSDFNIDQLVPILSDLTLAKTIINDMTCSLSEYKDSIYEIIAELKEASCVSDEIKAKVDKNVMSVLNDLNVNSNKTITLKNFGSKKVHLFERLARGISYKYKMCNGIVSENPELFKFDLICVDIMHRRIKVGDKSFQFSDSTDLFPDCSYDNPYNPYDNYDCNDENHCPEKVVKCFIKKLEVEIEKVLLLLSYLDVVSFSIKYTIDVINTDVLHFNLFDKTCLNLEC